MDIGRRIKELRASERLSQEELAARIYVSRQTISSWENDRTYPDVQSLLLLSEVFGETIDSLIKGDVEAMTETIDNDVCIMRRLGWTMALFLVLMLAAVAWCLVQLTVWNWTLAQTVPTLMLALVLWGVAMFAAIWVDRIKKRHDLITYHEILSFWNGGDVDRDTPRGRRLRLIPSWMKAIRTVGMTLLAAAAGAFAGYLGAMVADSLLHPF